MDPLSATANVLTLLEAVDKIRRKLISLRHAPDEWLALNNEVADLQLLIASPLQIASPSNYLLTMNRKALKSSISNSRKCGRAVLALNFIDNWRRQKRYFQILTSSLRTNSRRSTVIVASRLSTARFGFALKEKLTGSKPKFKNARSI